MSVEDKIYNCFEEFKQDLRLNCDESPARYVEFTFTPPADAPDYIYYQVFACIATVRLFTTVSEQQKYVNLQGILLLNSTLIVQLYISQYFIAWVRPVVESHGCQSMVMGWISGAVPGLFQLKVQRLGHGAYH